MTRSVVRRHLTVDAVADHLEGLLPGAVAVEAERHLGSCPECSAVRDDLLAVREVLAAQPADPMPSAVALRIETVLADAWSDIAAGHAVASHTRADVAATAADIAAADAEATTLDLAARGQRRQPRLRRIIPVFAAAAGTIGVVFTAAVVGPQLTGTSDDDAGAGAPLAEEREAGRSGDQTAGEMDSGAGEDSESGPSGGISAVQVSQSGRNYTSYTFAAGVADLLADQRASADNGLPPFSPDGPISPGSVTGSTTPPGSASTFELAAPGQPLAPFADGGERVRACIRELAGRDVNPVLVDLGTFAGDPAVVIVLPNESDPASATAWAVDQRCGTGLPPDETTYAVVTTPHPTAVPAPTSSPTLNQPPASSFSPQSPGTPPS